FNATLGIKDAHGGALPYLAATLPTLDTPTWQVTPDGQLVTSYALRPNLTWHDGAPLTADDFAFAWQVYTSPQVGIANVAPQNIMAAVDAPDPLTVVIHWKRPYPNAAVLDQADF